MTSDPRAAAAALLDGALVVLPTETVYGLAGSADDANAVARIYAVKGRPSQHPVIVHLADATGALDVEAGWVREVPAYAAALARAFWPGPMTLVLPRGARATDAITGGQDTVAVRVPGHDLAHRVLAAMDEIDAAGAPHGVAAPSANRFGRVSPTTAQHALDELSDHLDLQRDLVLDGGACSVGVESTIIDCTGDQPRILRPGGVSVADVARIAGSVALHAAPGSPRVPGGLPSHYAPQAAIALAGDEEAAQAYVDAANEGGLDSTLIGCIAPSTVGEISGAIRLASPSTGDEYARILYAALRSADDRGLRFVVAVPPAPDAGGISGAIIDRLRRAAAPRDS
jgi:L-threonylcarbamoyladenylate synthase